ncbi:MAG: hypothetical protein K1X75_16070 [Leptospirales bacterium]|nr:hypothetical protein [Leptospirales bacterium]
MKAKRLIQAASVAYLLLGVLHLMAEALRPDDAALLQLLAEMRAFRIQLLGEHNLLQFHTGFSIMMGFLMFTLGAQSFILANAIASDAKALWAATIFASIALSISILFFHLLADGLLLLSLLCFFAALILSKAKSSPMGSPSSQT